MTNVNIICGDYDGKLGYNYEASMTSMPDGDCAKYACMQVIEKDGLPAQQAFDALSVLHGPLIRQGKIADFMLEYFFTSMGITYCTTGQ